MAENTQDKVEDKIIDCINSGVTGRLIIFKPENGKLGADLAVERRGNYKEKEMFFQINSFVGHIKEDIFIKDFLQDGFKADKNLYLIFVYFDDVKQKINDDIWLIPSLQFRDIAETAKSPDGGKILKFQASVNARDRYSKFLVSSKGLGKLILNAFENKGKFDFKESNLQNEEEINIDSLRDFLCEARRNTYAANATPIDARLLASTQLEFQKGNFFYRDIFFSGTKKIIGQEIIYQDSKPIWGMNYMGNQIGKLETNFLKESLFKLAERCRLGGICENEKREYKYQDNGQGGVEEFSGQEQIFVQGKNTYKLDYKGGLISEKS
jgi:hypothetical protein